ncbi:hypothetical protein PG984_006110 [Apiospora sp. TS-2023a]
MPELKFIKKVAIVGATGTIGKYIVEALLQKGQHEVTAITRKGSTSVMPAGVTPAAVDYENPSTFVEALRGQEALIITLPSTGLDQQATQLKLVEAAAEADVPYVLPNEWTVDMADEKLADDVFFSGEREIHRRVEELGVSAWMAFVTSFWYEFSLGLSPLCYGLDWAGRTFTFYDEGTRKINTILSPWRRALPRNLQQQIRLRIVLSGQPAGHVRVSGSGDGHRPHKRLDAAARGGDRAGYMKLLYARVFFPDGACNFEARRGLDNKALGLPWEDLDEWTRVAIKNAEAGIKYGPGSGSS